MKMNRKTSPSLLRQITYVESLIRLIKDDLIRDHMLPDLGSVNLAISELESFRKCAIEKSKSMREMAANLSMPIQK